ALSPDPHDHYGRHARRRAADAWDRRGLGTSSATWLCDGRRACTEPAFDAFHYADPLSLSRSPAESAGPAPLIDLDGLHSPAQSRRMNGRTSRRRLISSSRTDTVAEQPADIASEVTKLP